LLRVMLDDPALLVWLDAGSNKKVSRMRIWLGSFWNCSRWGLGITQKVDVKEVARALTGLVVVQGQAGRSEGFAR